MLAANRSASAEVSAHMANTDTSARGAEAAGDGRKLLRKDRTAMLPPSLLINLA
ncbi:hypothetical protein D3C74_455750 [compost metagenome]